MDEAVNSILDPAVIAKPLPAEPKPEPKPDTPVKPDTKPDTKPAENGSGGGCNAGMAAIAMLVLVPFIKREHN